MPLHRTRSLSDAQAILVYRMYEDDYRSIRWLAAYFGVTRGAVQWALELMRRRVA